MSNPFTQFYKKNVNERKDVLKSLTLFDEALDIHAGDHTFNHIIENYITTYEVPLGIAPDFLIEGQKYHIPMATEEPSVIAGAAHAAKIIERNGGFKIESISREMIGQIIFKNIKDQETFKNTLLGIETKIFELAKIAHPQIHELGGGLRSYRVEIKEHNFVTLYATIDTLDAMGANTINTILERIAKYVESTYQVETLMSILSNLAVSSVVKASVLLDPKTLKFSDKIAESIHQAYLYASIDPYRAATHNKGIMNGITALMLATGNDTRAIESGAHAYASITGKYLPLTKWEVIDGMIKGTIEIPLALGTVGGSMGVLPKAKLARKILNVSSAKELMKVAACLGLAQNFAAIYALTTDGINKGHMRLHARNIAISAGAKDDQIEAVIQYMIDRNTITLDTAKAYLTKNPSL
ncbi:hydroxymethylglutaryl-CoA reductase, degradative [Acholeplasma hippikon]|nr:hydroxymethylglutaryl-CoA reductase, degradative [Acholeplasma hippikon]